MKFRSGAEYADFIKEARRELHKIPELAFSEYMTSAFIKERLAALGIKHRAAGVTGIIADIAGKNSKVTVALRSDMDALPITEENIVEYKSAHSGVMHACGHDGHMAMLLSAAKWFTANKPPVNLRLIFQPAEEGGGGAEKMIEGGALEGVTAIYGLHVDPLTQIGRITFAAGPGMAGALDIDYTIIGKAAHASQKELGMDALAAGTELVSELYKTYDAYSKNAIGRTLFHIGKIVSGNSANIVADKAVLCTTLRFFEEADEHALTPAFACACEKICKKYKTSYKTRIDSEYPVVYNDMELSKHVSGLWPDYTPMVPVFAAEDFAFYQHCVPGVFAWLGVRDEKNGRRLHSPTMDFDEAALVYGLEFYIRVVESYA